MQKQKESHLKINASHVENADTGKFLMATLFVCLSVSFTAKVSQQWIVMH